MNVLCAAPTGSLGGRRLHFEGSPSCQFRSSRRCPLSCQRPSPRLLRRSHSWRPIALTSSSSIVGSATSRGDDPDAERLYRWHIWCRDGGYEPDGARCCRFGDRTPHQAELHPGTARISHCRCSDSEHFRSCPRTCPATLVHTGCHRRCAVGSSASEKEQHLQTLSVRFRGGTA